MGKIAIFVLFFLIPLVTSSGYTVSHTEVDYYLGNQQRISRISINE